MKCLVEKDELKKYTSMDVKLCTDCFNSLEEKTAERNLPGWAPSFAAMESTRNGQGAAGATAPVAEPMEGRLENVRHVKHDRLRNARKVVHSAQEKSERHDSITQIFLNLQEARKMVQACKETEGRMELTMPMNPYPGCTISRNQQLLALGKHFFHPTHFMALDLAELQSKSSTLSFQVKTESSVNAMREVDCQFIGGLEQGCQFVEGYPVIVENAVGGLQAGDTLIKCKHDGGEFVPLCYKKLKLLDRVRLEHDERNLISVVFRDIKAPEVTSEAQLLADFPFLFEALPPIFAESCTAVGSFPNQFYHMLKYEDRKSVV